MTDEAKKNLTGKQKLFVEYYLGAARFNATEAAHLAGYKGNRNALGVIGHTLLRNTKISASVSERINEAAMSANEVLARLSAMARGSVSDVLNDDERFDLKEARRREKDGLIKKLKVERTSRVVRELDRRGEYDDELENSILTEKTEFELYDAQAALVHLGKYHRLFVEWHEHADANGEPLMKPFADALLKIYGDKSGTT